MTESKRDRAGLKGWSWGPSISGGPAEIEAGSGDDGKDSDGEAGTGMGTDTDRACNPEGHGVESRNLVPQSRNPRGSRYTFLFLVPTLVCLSQEPFSNPDTALRSQQGQEVIQGHCKMLVGHDKIAKGKLH